MGNVTDLAFQRICLDGNDWKLAGYWPNAWRLGRSKELGADLAPLLPPCKARVPGAVQLDLMAAGEIGDYNTGLESRAAEWVEHWEWIYSRTVQVPEDFSGKRILLEFDGLDHSGTVAVDGKAVGNFHGTHLPHTFDITDVVTPGSEFVLSVLFDTPPRLIGQLGYTHSVKDFKPRFNYVWDWIARTVSIGIWDSVHLVAYTCPRISSLAVNVDLDLDSQSGGEPIGEVVIRGELDNYTWGTDLALTYELSEISDGQASEESLVEGRAWITAREFNEVFCVLHPNLWWPNGMGEQNLYELRINLTACGQVLDQRTMQLGFRSAKWVATPTAPKSARPSTLELNGSRVYLRGANWVPLSPFVGGPTTVDYKQMISRYKAMNVNLLRVWGGAILEHKEFYDACDEAGIMVWQEFPLSSAGCSDYPPDDPNSVASMARIVESMVKRRCHHPSHVLWCGGNELAKGFDGRLEGREVPIDTDHPMIAEMDRMVKKWDPSKKFIPTSGHGPRAFGVEGDFGKGVHHDVHGHWAYLGPDSHYSYYNDDDALWRSEVGVPGATRRQLFDRYSGGINPWPPTRANRLWLHHGSWWIGWDQMNAVFGPWDAQDESQLDQYLACSRYLQAEGYRYVLESCRRRAFACSLNTIWMGHDCYWTTSNNSVIEVDGSLKPAWSYCQRAYSSLKVSLKYVKCYAMPGEILDVSVWSSRDDVCESWVEGSQSTISGSLSVALRLANGEVVKSVQRDVEVARNGSVRLMDLSFEAPDDSQGLFFIELMLSVAGQTSRDVYAFGQSSEHPFSALRNLPQTSLSVNVAEITVDHMRITLRNEGEVAAVMVEVEPIGTPSTIITSGNSMTIFPGEESVVELSSCVVGESLPQLHTKALNTPSQAI